MSFDGTGRNIVGDLNNTTGWLYGGQVTINSGDTSTLDISAGACIITDYSTPNTPVHTPISWEAQVGFNPSLSGRSTWIGVQNNAGVAQFVSIPMPTPSDFRETAILCRVWDTAGTGPTITSVGDYERPCWGLGNAYQDYVLELGSWNISGNVLSANGANLLLDKSAGQSYRYHSQDTIGLENVHTDVAKIAISAYNYHLQGVDSTSSESTIDPNNYDNSGVKTIVPSQKWTVQEVWTFPVSGTVHVLYGQEVYNSKVNALQGVSRENKVRNDAILDGAIFRAYIVIQQGSTTLSGVEIITEKSRKEPRRESDKKFVNRSYAISDYGTPDVFYSAGYYDASDTDVTLTIGGTTTETYGNANEAYGAHAFCVASGAGGTDLVLTVSGTSITDEGVRTTSDTEIIVADTDQAITDQYFETRKKWLGEITYTLTGASGSFTFNYGLAKYEDFGNKDFEVTDFEIVGLSTTNTADYDVQLLYHSDQGWTYASSDFSPGGIKICSMAEDYGTDTEQGTYKYFAYKRANLLQQVSGSTTEGVVVKMIQTTGNSIRYGTVQIGVLY